MKEETLKMEA